MATEKISASKKWKRVLITGASSGLGEEYAWQFSACAEELILVARREDRLLSLAANVEKKFPSTKVHTYMADLTNEAERNGLLTWISEQDLPPDVLVNNAGMGDYGDFSTAEWGKTKAMMELNMTALTQLTLALLPSLKASSRGAILNISSLASIVPIPDFAVYAATKAYVTSFSEALRIELLEEGLPVVAVCPGPVATEFGDQARRDDGESAFAGREYLYVEAREVVRGSIQALEKNRPRYFPGRLVSLLALAVQNLPLWMSRKILSKRPRRKKS